MPTIKQRAAHWNRAWSSLFSTLFFLGILVFVALIVEGRPWRVDLTETGKHSLSAQTLSILQSLDGPVEIKAFFQTATPDEAHARDLLETYRYHSDRIRYEFIDPDRRPEVAKRYEIRTYGTLVVEGFGKKQSIQSVDEQTITNAILKLSREEQKKIYFLVGHGERSSEMGDKEGLFNARSALQKENYVVEDLMLMQRQSVPDDAALVVVAGPRKPLFPEEIERLRTFVDRGGRLMVLLDPFHDGGLKEFLKSYGVEVRDDVIVDESMGLFGGNYLMPVVASYAAHPITDNFTFATFYPEARSLQVMEPLPDGIHVEPLAMTSANAWGETNLELLRAGQVGFDPDADHAGPLNLIVLAEIETAGRGGVQKSAGDASDPSRQDGEDGAARTAYILVAGDGDFASDGYFALSGNGDLFLNMTNFLAGEEDLITIERREREGQPLLLSETQFWVMVWTVLVLVPLLVLVAGLGVFRVRRRQR